MYAETRKLTAVAALALLVPAPTIGVMAGMYLAPDSVVGIGLFAFLKLWILALPLVWRLVVDRERLSWSPVRKGGMGFGLALGLGISVLIVTGYLFFGRRLIDPAMMREMLKGVGLGSPAVYIGAATYWILVNSVLEEYVWRWFVVSRLRAFMPAAAAVVVSALAFTIHHIFAMSLYFDVIVVAAGAFGIFIGGAVWSWCYIRYESIWPGYLSHAVVDLAVFGIGYHILFG